MDNNNQRLSELSEQLKTHLPDCTVTEFTVPMLSAKFILNNEVDIVYAQEEMERVTGEELKHVLSINRPQLKVNLFYEIKEVVIQINSLFIIYLKSKRIYQIQMDYANLENRMRLV